MTQRQTVVNYIPNKWMTSIDGTDVYNRYKKYFKVGRFMASLFTVLESVSSSKQLQTCLSKHFIFGPAPVTKRQKIYLCNHFKGC